MLEKTLESPLDWKEIKPVHLKANQSEIFIGSTDAETPILWPRDAKNWVLRKDPDAGKDWRQEEKGTTEEEMVGCHHWLDGHEFEQALGVGDGQGSLVCCSPWGCRVRHDWGTELNWTEAHSQGSKCFYTDNNRLLRVISQNIKTISIFSWSPNNCARWTHCQRVQPCRPRGPQCAAHHCPQWFSALWLSPLLWGSQPFPYIRNTQGILSKDTDALNPLLTFSFHCWDKSPRVSGLLNIRQSQFLVVYWLRLCAPSGGGLGFISGQETRSHMPQLRIPHPTTNIGDPANCN